MSLMKKVYHVRETCAFNWPMHSVEKVKKFIERYPLSIQEKSAIGRLPLHKVACYDVRIEMVEFVLSSYPEAIKVADFRGHLPFHLALKSRLSHDCLQVFLDAYPDACRIPNQEGQYPLHLACEASSPLPILEQIIKYNPQALYQEDEEGNLPFHLAKSADSVRVLLESDFKNQLLLADSNNLPLHRACHDNKSVEIIQLLLEKIPDQLFQQDCENGNLPLHLAIKYGCSLEVIEFLVSAARDKKEEILTTRNFLGDTPLNCAVKFLAPVNVIDLLARTSSQAALLQDSTTPTSIPLHLAFSHHEPYVFIPKEMIQVLLQHCPTCVEVKNSYGQLALHLAIEFFKLQLGVDESSYYEDNMKEIIQMLVDIYPDSLSIPDKDGCLPLTTVLMDPMLIHERRNEHRQHRHAVKARHPLLQDITSRKVIPSIISTRVSSGLTVVQTAQRPRSALSLIGDRGSSNLNTMYEKNNRITLVLGAILIEKGPEVLAIAHPTNRKLALHVACSNGAPVEIIKLLVRYHPQAIHSSDQIGFTPLHYESSHLARLSVLQELYTKKDLLCKPRGASSQHPVMPLFLACENPNASLDVICYLLEHSMELFSKWGLPS